MAAGGAARFMWQQHIASTRSAASRNQHPRSMAKAKTTSSYQHISWQHHWQSWLLMAAWRNGGEEAPLKQRIAAQHICAMA